MIIDLNKLNTQDSIILDKDFHLDLTNNQNKDIKALKNLHVQGTIKYNIMNLLQMDLTITGVMILKDSVTLEDLEYPFTSESSEEYSLESEFLQEYYQKSQNVLDISAILWENIVLEVPISLTTTKDAKMSGEGWSLGEYEENKDESIDPRLAKLTELITKREE